MLNLFDSHTHIYMPEFATEDGDAAAGARAAAERAIAEGVGMMMLPNVDRSTVEPLQRLAAAFPDNIITAAGLHPTEVDDHWRDTTDEILALMPAARAIGEVGIDLYWDASRREQQMQAFDYQLSVAERMGLPVIIHCREALDPTLEVLRDHPGARCVMHSFTGTPAEVDRIRAVGDYLFGANGIITFKNARLDGTLREITPSRLLLETDSPYLAPVPRRGKRNESALLPYICRRAAQALDMTDEETASATTANARRFFGLD